MQQHLEEVRIGSVLAAKAERHGYRRTERVPAHQA